MCPHKRVHSGDLKREASLGDEGVGARGRVAGALRGGARKAAAALPWGPASRRRCADNELLTEAPGPVGLGGGGRKYGGPCREGGLGRGRGGGARRPGPGPGARASNARRPRLPGATRRGQRKGGKARGPARAASELPTSWAPILTASSFLPPPARRRRRRDSQSPPSRARTP